MLKKETRIIAFDDCAFTFDQKSVLVIGVVFRGAEYLDGLVSFSVKKDGNDVTDEIIKAVKSSRHHDQISYIMMKGISFAGLNIADIKKISESMKIPVIVVQRKAPDINEFKKALKKFNDSSRTSAVDSAGPFYSHKNAWFQCAGCDISEAHDILDLTCMRANIPEPLRVAHIIASGISGDSHGRA
jgi:endonuclease V-like protein UPF0215 family